MSDQQVTVKLTADVVQHNAGFAAATAAHDNFVRSGRTVERQTDLLVKSLGSAKNPAEAFSNALEHAGRALELGLAGGAGVAALGVFVSKLGEAASRSEDFYVAVQDIGASDFSHTVTSAEAYTAEIGKAQALLNQLHQTTVGMTTDNWMENMFSGVKSGAGFDYLWKTISSGGDTSAYDKSQMDALKTLQMDIQRESGNNARESIQPQNDIIQLQIDGNQELANWHKVQIDLRKQYNDLASQGRTAEALAIKEQIDLTRELFRNQTNFTRTQLSDDITIATERLDLKQAGFGQGGINGMPMTQNRMAADLAASQRDKIMEQTNFSGDQAGVGKAEMAMIQLRDSLTMSPEQRLSGIQVDDLQAVGGGGRSSAGPTYSAEMLDVLKSIDSSIEVIAGKREEVATGNIQKMQ